MSDNEIVIRSEGISKAYRIGVKDQRYDTLGAALVSWLKSPVANFRRVRSLSNIKTNDEDDSVFWALRGIDFDVKRGDVLGIIGRNGAGKSTLLKILSRITEPTSGRIRIYGRVASLLEVGTGFNPELTGRENVFLNGAILGMTKREIESKFDEIVDFSGVERFIDTPVKRYSSGMKVRLAFAVAAHLDPEILIIDEVLAVGDFEFQKKCLGKMNDIAEAEGRTVLFVSHDMSAVQKLCNTGICLVDGKIAFRGTAVDAAEYYFKSWKNPELTSAINLNFAGRRGDGPVKVESVVTLTEDYQPHVNFQIGQSIVIKISIKAETDLTGVLIGFAIKSINGTEVFHSTSRYSDVGMVVNQGVTEVLVKYDPNVLMPGMYSFRVSLHWNNALSDRVDDICRFEIDNIAKTPERIPDYKVGHFYYPISWSKR